MFIDNCSEPGFATLSTIFYAGCAAVKSCTRVLRSEQVRFIVYISAVRIRTLQVQKPCAGANLCAF